MQSVDDLLSRMPPTLTATYRLQLHHDFGFGDVESVAPYLARLGVSHIYTSPILAARPGSTHGYDVTDPSRANPELGGEKRRVALADALTRCGLGHLLDIVPNHMGIGPSNLYWDDVLRHGRQSRWAHWFDIEWDAPGDRGRVVLPVLGRPLEEVLADDELSIVLERDELRVRYFDRSFPLDPSTTSVLPTDALDVWRAGTEGRERLRRLLRQQHYRLAFWRHAANALNYRRFFDISDLAALRVEDPGVFDAVHERVLAWVSEGSIDAMRIDHIDGLRDPLAYLERLRREATSRRPASPIPLFVEKILSAGEHLRDEWPVAGTTGYEFLNDLEAAFIDPEGFAHIERAYLRLSRVPGHARGFEEVAVRGKLKILRGSLRSEVSRLVRLLAPIARAAFEGAPPRRSELVTALEQFIACYSVYRSYIDARDGGVDPEDRRIVNAAVEHARTRGEATTALLDLLSAVMLRDGADSLSETERAQRLELTLRLQQTSGAATAKGVEDTALYQYVPLVSLNEVGGAPDRPLASAVQRLHDGNAERAMRWPLSLVTTNTHDAKRSADVRARLDALSEMPRDWLAAVARWRRMAAPLRGRSGRRVVPDPNTEYLLYQTLVGMWPLGNGTMVPPDEDLVRLRERVTEYLVKAVREGKQRSTWTESDERYEAALEVFLTALLEGERSARWRADFAQFAHRVARPGLWTALSRVLVHLTAPGTPDVYQGDELWNFSLVDPDNRRPVDFSVRARLLAELDVVSCGDGPLPEESLRAMMEAPEDGRIKLYVTSRLLRERRRYAALYGSGAYRALAAVGLRAGHVLAYARDGDGGPAIVIAPRLVYTLTGDAAPPLGAEVWSDTTIPVGVASARGWTCVLSGHTIELDERDGGGHLRVADALRILPVAVLRPASTE